MPTPTRKESMLLKNRLPTLKPLLLPDRKKRKSQIKVVIPGAATAATATPMILTTVATSNGKALLNGVVPRSLSSGVANNGKNLPSPSHSGEANSGAASRLTHGHLNKKKKRKKSPSSSNGVASSGAASKATILGATLPSRGEHSRKHDERKGRLQGNHPVNSHVHYEL